eukprot:gene20499-26593_t
MRQSSFRRDISILRPNTAPELSLFQPSIKSKDELENISPVSPVQEERYVDGILWFQISKGWICTIDVNDNNKNVFIISNETEANKSWAIEFDTRRRIAEAIVSMLVRSYPLIKARRIARSIMSGCEDVNAKTLLNVSNTSLENLLVSINITNIPKHQTILDYIKTAAVRQSNPYVAMIEISKEIYYIITLRPTLWVKKDLSVLKTYDSQSKNDSFIFAAARGNVKEFNKYMNNGQELIALHSELKYTALHAAADFGQVEIVTILIKSGMSVNIREIRKGQTPLHFAGSSGRKEIITLLLESGADRMIRDNEGHYAYELAHDQGHYECREMLKFLPPAIQTLIVSNVTNRSIDISWSPASTSNSLHAEVIEYISLAGWSNGSDKLIQYTLSCAPDPPQHIDIIRVTVNGLYIYWYAPKYNNGGEVDTYHIQIVDCNAKSLYTDFDQLEDQMDNTSSRLSRKLRNAISQSANGQLDSAISEKSKYYHRLIRHNNVNERYRVISGLKTENQYIIRMKCHNEYGTSDWSDWSLPIRPIQSINTLEYNAISNSLTITWFEPILTQVDSITNSPKNITSSDLKSNVYFAKGKSYKQRRVTAYELQISKLKGPLFKRIELDKNLSNIHDDEDDESIQNNNNDNNDINTAIGKQLDVQKDNPIDKQIDNQLDKEVNIDSNDTSHQQEYITLSNTITTNSFDLVDLSPGCKYICRIRAQINNRWLDWDTAMTSNAITIPARPPDPPINVRCKKINEDVNRLDRIIVDGSIVNEIDNIIESDFSKTHTNGSNIYSKVDSKFNDKIDSKEDSKADIKTILKSDNSSKTKNKVSFQIDKIDSTSIANSNEVTDDEDVSHDNAVIYWTIDKTNGSPITSVQ